MYDCFMRGQQKRCIYYYSFDTANKKQALKEYNGFTQAIQAKTPKQQTLAHTFKRKEKYPGDSDMAKNITEKVIKLIALDNQLISVVEDQGFLCHLELLNPFYGLPSQHYITLVHLQSQRAGMHTSLVGLIQQSM